MYSRWLEKNQFLYKLQKQILQRKPQYNKNIIRHNRWSAKDLASKQTWNQLYDQNR